MARTAVLKAKKKPVVRATRRLSGFALAPTDSFWKAKHFVHYEIESREWGAKIKEYAKKFLSKTDVAHINRLPEWKTSNYSHWAITAYWLMNDLTPPESYVTGFKKYLDGLIEEGKQVAKKEQAAEKVVKTAVYTPTIQERIADQAAEAIEDIEEWLDSFLTDKQNFDPKGFDFTAHFAKFKVSQAHARKIMANYQSELEEARLMVNLPTPQQIAKIKDEREKDFAQQLREGYSHLSKKDAQSYLTALETLVGACMLVIDASKATRKPRAKKAPSKEKIIAKLKYKATDEKYQIASVNPLELIGATEIWVFNTKTRKLGKYIAAADAGVMNVKGSALIGYDEEKSVQKTLRKPEETLKEFKNAGKIKLRKFLEEIKTTDTKLSGRINEDTIILKALQ
jgi:hypothetical protein